MRTGIFMVAVMASMLLAPAPHAARDPASAKLFKSTSDHSKFKALQQDFKSGPEVTKACLSCHTEASKQIHRTQHWRWEFLNPDGKRLGKKNVINNFCTSVASNYAYCATCHIGYGWKDDQFDFTSEENVDCLVCHDTTGNYKKPPGFAGNVVTNATEFPPGSGKIVKAIDLKAIAQGIAKTSRDTCGACHFFGGGGDGVKHGDLDSSLEAPDKALDVHMDATGNNFSRATCQACHGQAPHQAKLAKLNDHTDKVACQTCHIPAYARGGVPTKMSWDWSTAGKMGPDGKPLIKKDAKGHVIYTAAKGDFVLAENVVPEYMWFNGKVKYILFGDKVENSDRPTRINHFEGSATDGKSMIWPVKVFRGRQAYDPVNKSLAVLHMAGNDDTAFWTNFNWEKAVAVGMASVGAPFSGKVDFVTTESMWPITHMVAPAKDSLRCRDCHASGGRLEKVSGIYISGRGSDHAGWLETTGWIMAVLTLLGVVGHGLGRFIAFKRKK